MPLAFPSHQGLIAPLWRRWPRRFHVLGLCIGAASPDIVDGILGAWRGYLGQWYGHTLVGLFALCLPICLLLTWLTILVGRRLAWLGRGIEGVSNVPRSASRPRQIAFVAGSVLVGAFSHLVFDLISHGNFPWLYPWHEIARIFPSWWYVQWFAVRLPCYREPHAIGPPMVIWLILSLLGAVMLFRPWLARRRRV